MDDQLDKLKINFDESGLWVLNLAIAVVMFGIAIGITIDDFKRLFKSPKILFTGIISQFILFPAITFLFVKAIDTTPSIALGIFMVAACPGGNISNFITQLAKGNSALSISMTAFATLISIVMTPLNFHFWSSLHEPTATILNTIEMNPAKLIKLVLLILALPLVLGMVLRHWKPNITKKLIRFLKPFSLLVFLILIIMAFSKNFSIFLEHIHYVLFIVIAHNLIGYLLGFYFSKIMKLDYQNQKTISIETGIQNAGLGLMLVFTFFNDFGGMKLLVAFWAIWDIVSGLALATFWARMHKRNKA